jgi:hypothetical protein
MWKRVRQTKSEPLPRVFAPALVIGVAFVRHQPPEMMLGQHERPEAKSEGGVTRRY